MGRLFQILAEGLRVASLDLLHVIQIGWIEELSPEQNISELGFRLKNRLHTFRSFALPTRTDNHERAAVVAITSRSQIGEIEGLEIDHLTGLVAILFDLRHGHDNGLGAQVHPEKRIRSVGVWRDHEFVLRRRHVRRTRNGVERDAVARTHRITVSKIA